MLQNASEHKAAAERDVNARDIQRDDLLNQLEKCVHGYNTKACELKLLPVNSKHSMGTDFSIQIDRETADLQNLCVADHKARSVTVKG